jgi:hypothetical protein
VRQDLSALSGGEITTGCLCTVVYDGTFFELTDAIGDAVLRNPAGSLNQNIVGPVTLQGSQVYLGLENSAATANNGVWLLESLYTAGVGSISLAAANDALSSASSVISATRTGAAINTVTLGGTAQVGTTQAFTDSSTNLATTNFVHTVLSDSPLLGGNPTLSFTPSPGDNSTSIADTAFVTNGLATAVAGLALSGTVGANGSISAPVPGAPNGQVTIKWGFHSPGSHSSAGLETISFPVAFPHHCYFAAAFGNRNSVVGSTGVATGYVYQPGLSTASFQAVLDDDASGNRSGLWMAIGD